jgi:S1-C subfamily serine protease
MRKDSFLVLVFVVFASPLFAQDSLVKLKVYAAIVDKELNPKPVPKLSLALRKLGEENSKTIALRTGFDGKTEIELDPGHYKLSTPQAIEFQGKQYSWDLEIDVIQRETTIDLSNDNAKIVEVSSDRSSRKTDELTTLYKDLERSVGTVWSEFGHGTGFIIDPSGLVITNQHVIGPSEYIAFQFDQMRKVPARLLVASPEKDVAILWVDLKAIPDATVAPLAETKGGEPTVVEGERVFTIGSPLSQRKMLTTGIASKVESRAILSDININPGNSGGPLFNSLGKVVGLTTFGEQEHSGPGVSGIIRIEEALPLLAQAAQKTKQLSVPDPTLLPVEPSDSFPLDAIKDAIEVAKFDGRPYLFGVGDYDVALITPILLYRSRYESKVAAAKEKEKRSKNKVTAVKGTMQPLEELRNWAEYVGEYKPILIVRASPKLRETFWSAFGRGLAASGGYYGGPARMKFKTDFYKMRLLCGNKEVEPIQPGKIANVLDVRNVFVSVTDATYEGFYTYPADAVSSGCSTVTLELYSEKDPSKATRKVLDPKSVTRVTSDFEPYLKAVKATGAKKPS